MLNIYQSNQTEQLLIHLLNAYKSDDINMFEPFLVLVPSMVLGEWLQNRIADKAGISTLITTEFWGRYQWQMMKQVIEAFNQETGDNAIHVPDVAMLSTSVMQWRLFAYLLECYGQYLNTISTNNPPKHHESMNSSQISSLYPLFAKVYEIAGVHNNVHGNNNLDVSVSKSEEQQLWRLAQSLAAAFNRYLTHRDDWIGLWTKNHALNIRQLIAQKDWLSQQFDEHASDTPEWIQENYVELEMAQRHLWHTLFAKLYEERQTIEKRFWQGLPNHKNTLPKRLFIFTIQQMPLTELDFIRRLSTFIDIELLFYNPSQAYWADIVDKRWLIQQQIINPSMAYVRDFGHTLLSRLGKQSRDTFASLVELSGNVAKEQRLSPMSAKHSKSEQSIQAMQHDFMATNFMVTWQDDFVSYDNDDNFMNDDDVAQSSSRLSLLKKLQQDVLVMDDALTRQYIQQQIIKQSQEELTSQAMSDFQSQLKNRQWQQGIIDNSLSIHSCHNLQRQLEVMRAMIARWLNDNPNRQPSDILVLLPDVDNHHDLIQSMFGAEKGVDGLNLPAKVTGVVDRQIRSLWQAIVGYYQLLGQAHASFGWSQVYDWLMLPEVYQSYGLVYEQMQRGCELLRQAGFIRGFDESHLRQTLHEKDTDYRFCFAYALDRLVAGVFMPKAKLTDMIYRPAQNQVSFTLPLSQISLNDTPIIAALCQIYQALAQHRHDYQTKQPAMNWLNSIETDIIHRYFALFDDSKSMRAIFTAINGLKKSLTANGLTAKQLKFRLEFLLQSIEKQLEAQQISAEPTGMITFARFGALRTVPYRLIIMLNMDISQFPRQERDDYHDLMKAGLARRGDKRSDDEDNGAFLDALMCAKEACWIFYNGQQMGEAVEHLPAQPVSELIQFLQAEVDWQFNEQSSLSFVNNHAQTITDTGILSEIKKTIQEQILSRLVIKHPPLPYDSSVFEQPITHHISNNDNEQTGNEDINLADLFADTLNTYQIRQKTNLPPAPIWQDIYQALYQVQQTPFVPAIALPNDTDYQKIISDLSASLDAKLDIKDLTTANDTWQLSVDELLRYFSNPAKHYLKQQQIAIRHSQKESDTLEPMVLNHLTNYQLTDYLLEHLNHIQDSNQNTSAASLKAVSLNAMLLNDTLLPAGVNRHKILSQQIQELKQQFDALAMALEQSQYAHLLPLSDTDISDSELKLDKYITPVSEQQVTFITPMTAITPMATQLTQPIQVNIHVKLPKQLNQKLWLNVLPKKDHTKHKLTMWFHHLLWQMQRQQDMTEPLAGTSIWQFKESSAYVLAPISHANAKAELQKWLLLAQWLDDHLMVMMPKHAFTYLEKLTQQKEKDENQQSYVPNKKDFKFALDEKSQDIEDNLNHPIWRYVLAGYDDDKKFNVLCETLQALAEPIYGNLYESILPLNKTHNKD